MNQREKTERTRNVAVAVLIALLLLASIFGAQAFRGTGFFAPTSAAAGQPNEDSAPNPALIRVETVTGNADVERSGLSMALLEGMECRTGDTVYVRAGSSVRLGIGGSGALVLPAGIRAIVREGGVVEIIASETPAVASSSSTVSEDSANEVPNEAVGAVVSASEPSDATSQSSTQKTCTVEIRCDTILKNRDNLKAGKSKYVPEDGVILGSATAALEEGDTAFDVLKRVCEEAGVQLEYAYTPAYDAYYVEGIGNLYERDCGQQSGWLFKIDGVFPNYGPSKIAVEPGQVIEWVYSCEGAGADVKAGMDS